MSSAITSMTDSPIAAPADAELRGKKSPTALEYEPPALIKRATPAQAKATRQLIWEAINDLFNQDQVVSREAIREATGLTMSKVDDNVSRLIEDEQIRRVKNGVFVPIPRYDPPRPVYGTMTTDGFFVLEIGDQVITMQPREARQAGALLAGQFVQFSNIQSGHDANYLVNVVWEELKRLKRDLGES
ncbi:hypothetical protein [Ottowia thiooxydans]|uniref:hypothetical protein n=1 Tax=Ottowia thiooxydans TaxID=219182 RepID=UPI00041B2F05|nr:hypothetical protein [Ottowia thiooxydans]